MSRIEEALKRAREAASGEAPSPPPATEVFTDAWTVDEENIQTAAPAAATDVVGPGHGPATEAPAPPVAAQEAPAEVPRSPADEVFRSFAEARQREGGSPAVDAKREGGPAGIALFQGFNPTEVEKIVATPDIRPAFVEQYRKLAGVLHHAQLAKNLKVVMVTSAVAGEGKSLTATNLALTFSESYRRSVLLIDADLRRPTLHATFQVPNISGLGDGLRADKEQKLALVQVSPRLTLLTAGRPDPDPMSGLTSDRMRRVIEEAASRFDWVIIDTPPVGLLPDAHLLAAMADTTLLVIRAVKTPYQFVRRAVDTIGRERIFGAVLNRAEDEGGAVGYSYYSYYDSYSKGKSA